MDIYLPIAGQSVDALSSSSSLGFLVGVLSGMFGVGGGFLTTPLLIFYGIPPTVASRLGDDPDHRRQRVRSDGPLARGGVEMKMAGVMTPAALFGSVVGAVLFRGLQSSGQIDVVIGLLYVVILAAIGFLMLKDSLIALGYIGAEEPAPAARATIAGSPRCRCAGGPLPSGLYFRRSLPLALGFLAGVLFTVSSASAAGSSSFPR